MIVPQWLYHNKIVPPKCMIIIKDITSHDNVKLIKQNYFLKMIYIYELKKYKFLFKKKMYLTDNYCNNYSVFVDY